MHLKIALQNTRRLTELKRERDKSTITAEDLAALSVSDGIYQKRKKTKNRRPTEDLNNTINELDLISIYRTLSLLAEYIFFPSALKYLPRYTIGWVIKQV